MSLLEATRLSKRYQSRAVVNEVSLSVRSGEVVGLLGPNGAGKTTCFYMIVGLIRCDQGRIQLGNHDISRRPMDARARLGLGYLPQEPSVFRKLTVAENILAILETRHRLSRQDRRQRLDDLMHEFHIGHLHDRLGASLSGGERRRLEIARALAADPRFILLDEPFAGIDPLNVIDIKRMVTHLRERGVGVLITDHNVQETLDICGHAYIMNEGEVIAHGTPAEILANQQVRDVYLGDRFGR